MKRRDFVTLFGGAAAAWPLAVRAQQRERIPRIGYLSPISASEDAMYRDAFRAGLRDLGYVEGKNLQIEFRYAEGERGSLFGLATELVSLKVDVVVCYGIGAEAARQATALIPVVMAVGFGDPLIHNIISKLSRPGGNMTGMTILLAQIMLKRLDLLKQVVPSMKKIGVLLLPENLGNPGTILPMEIAAKAMDVEIHPLEASNYPAYENAFLAWTEAKIDAVVIADQPQFLVGAAGLAGLAEKHRLASIGSLELAAGGGLIGYGVNLLPMFRRAAIFVDKILKGESPGNIPIEQPTKFQLVINLRTAKALGLAVPPSLLATADEVIE